MSIVRFSVKTGGSDDGDASQDSFASYASSCADLESSASLSSLAHHFESTEKTSRASAKGNSAAYVPMTPGERAKQEAQRADAIEKTWNAEESRLRDGEQLEAMREELRQVTEKLSHSQAESKYRDRRLRTEHVCQFVRSQENRVLRREQTAGKRDEVILQLETELQVKEDERADMEENLAAAFSEVVKDLTSRVSALTAERDQLLISLEEVKSRRK
ncbi:MAG: hypothetical protein SGPRY_006888 [Prymnesium sp.]